MAPRSAHPHRVLGSLWLKANTRQQITEVKPIVQEEENTQREYPRATTVQKREKRSWSLLPRSLGDEVRAQYARSMAFPCDEKIRQMQGKTRLIHGVAPEAFVVHWGNSLVHHHVWLKARLERHRVRKSFERAREWMESARKVIRGSRWT